MIHTHTHTLVGPSVNAWWRTPPIILANPQLFRSEIPRLTPIAHTAAIGVDPADSETRGA